jgi:hypothetical protein
MIKFLIYSTGNLLSFITIVTMKKRNLFHNLLLTLTIFDTFFLLCGGIFFVQRAFQFKSDIYNFFLPLVIYPMAGISMTGKTKDHIDAFTPALVDCHL